MTGHKFRAEQVKSTTQNISHKLPIRQYFQVEILLGNKPLGHLSLNQINRFFPLKPTKEEWAFILSIVQMCLLSTNSVSYIVLDLGKLHFSGKHITNFKKTKSISKYTQYVVMNAMEKNQTVKYIGIWQFTKQGSQRRSN